LAIHQQPEVNDLPRFSPQLISLERYTLSVYRAGEIDLFENLDIVHNRLLVDVQEKVIQVVPFSLYSGCTNLTQSVFLESFCKSRLPHKSVNVSLTVTNMKNKLTDCCEV